VSLVCGARRERVEVGEPRTPDRLVSVEAFQREPEEDVPSAGGGEGQGQHGEGEPRDRVLDPLGRLHHLDRVEPEDRVGGVVRRAADLEKRPEPIPGSVRVSARDALLDRLRLRGGSAQGAAKSLQLLLLER
jgi:hypothetical protein